MSNYKRKLVNQIITDLQNLDFYTFKNLYKDIQIGNGSWTSVYNIGMKHVLIITIEKSKRFYINNQLKSKHFPKLKSINTFEKRIEYNKLVEFDIYIGKKLFNPNHQQYKEVSSLHNTYHNSKIYTINNELIDKIKLVNASVARALRILNKKIYSLDYNLDISEPNILFDSNNNLILNDIFYLTDTRCIDWA